MIEKVMEGDGVFVLSLWLGISLWTFERCEI